LAGARGCIPRESVLEMVGSKPGMEDGQDGEAGHVLGRKACRRKMCLAQLCTALWTGPHVCLVSASAQKKCHRPC
jgi:hypothetical protein